MRKHWTSRKSPYLLGSPNLWICGDADRPEDLRLAQSQCSDILAVSTAEGSEATARREIILSLWYENQIALLYAKCDRCDCSSARNSFIFMICELVFMMMLLVFLYPTQLHFYCLSFCGGARASGFPKSVNLPLHLRAGKDINYMVKRELFRRSFYDHVNWNKRKCRGAPKVKWRHREIKHSLMMKVWPEIEEARGRHSSQKN